MAIAIFNGLNRKENCYLEMTDSLDAISNMIIELNENTGLFIQETHNILND